jgi:asparagine synthase (glutamine-hydrolysing)
MCGLAGILSSGALLREQRDQLVQRMAAELVHRGPDSHSAYSDSSISLAFERLSIVGGADGRQPILNETGSLVAMVNGEIYNHLELRRGLDRHHFRGTSDTEVVLHLFEEKGPQAFAELRGMFACVIWDRVAQVVTLARDRFGIKPLFYHHQQGDLFFASELKALLSCPLCPAEFNWLEALTNPWLSEDLVFSSSPAGTFFRDLESIPPGMYLQVHLNQPVATLGRYWAPIEPVPSSDKKAEAYIEEYRELLRAASRESFDSSSVPALMLSGGIDSASLAAFGKEKDAVFDSFTVHTQSTALNGDAVGAKRLARQLDFENHQLCIDSADPLISPSLWLHLLDITESPSCGPEQLYKFLLLRFAKELRPSLRVMLSGQGSDECNGGYTRMLAAIGEGTWEGAAFSLETIAQNTYHRELQGSFTGWDEFPGLIKRDFICSQRAPRTDPWALYQLSKLHDLEMFNLWHEDRLNSHFGIEGRVPFLDHRLVELCLRVPQNLRAQLFWDKTILRAAMRPLLPADTLSREKIPFFYGAGVAFTEAMIARLLSSESSALLDRAFPSNSSGHQFLDVTRLRSHIEGLDNNVAASFPLMRLVNMGNLEQSARIRRWTAAPREFPHCGRVSFKEPTETVHPPLSSQRVGAAAWAEGLEWGESAPILIR